MAYASWSVVFGEQPSAAKWNILGTNDAAFNNGSGLPTANAQSSSVATTETTSSTSYTGLSTAHTLSVTIGSSGMALVIIQAAMYNNTTSAYCYMSYAISGATSASSSDTRAAYRKEDSATATVEAKQTFAKLHTGLTPGSNTFTTQFKVGAGTGSFSARDLTVIPL